MWRRIKLYTLLRLLSYSLMSKRSHDSMTDNLGPEIEVVARGRYEASIEEIQANIDTPITRTISVTVVGEDPTDSGRAFQQCAEVQQTVHALIERLGTLDDAETNNGKDVDYTTKAVTKYTTTWRGTVSVTLDKVDELVNALVAAVDQCGSVRTGALNIGTQGTEYLQNKALDVAFLTAYKKASVIAARASTKPPRVKYIAVNKTAQPLASLTGPADAAVRSESGVMSMAAAGMAVPASAAQTKGKHIISTAVTKSMEESQSVHVYFQVYA